MRILFVAPATSLHTVRWINQLENSGIDVHLFPCEPYPLNPGLRNVTLHHPVFRRRPFGERDLAELGMLVKPLPPAGWWESLWPERSFDGSVRQHGLWWPFRPGPHHIEAWLARLFPARLSRIARLGRTIQRLQPDIVHSLEIVTGGYLTLAARAACGDNFPAWIVSNWGSDLKLHGQLAAHKHSLRQTLGACDYYHAECARDVELARGFGFAGQALPILPNAGPFDLDRIQQLRRPEPPSARRLILLKGYQDWAGRALVALRALETIADGLGGYRIAIFLASPPVRIAAELMSQRTNIPVELVPFSPHDEMMRLHGQARVSIGVSISDGIPSSLVEAMAMGSFPIQSDSSCANEWIAHGSTGLIVAGEDPQGVADAIRVAITDDALVDRAAERNSAVIRQRLDSRRVRLQVAQTYKTIAEGHRSARAARSTV
jgi:glycosyltransferase involved in cell wall biosynthesis